MGPLTLFIYFPDETTLQSVQRMFMWASAGNFLFSNLIGNRLPSVSLFMRQLLGFDKGPSDGRGIEEKPLVENCSSSPSISSTPRSQLTAVVCGEEGGIFLPWGERVVGQRRGM